MIHSHPHDRARKDSAIAAVHPTGIDRAGLIQAGIAPTVPVPEEATR
jgi:hypothetical protein